MFRCHATERMLKKFLAALALFTALWLYGCESLSEDDSEFEDGDAENEIDSLENENFNEEDSESIDGDSEDGKEIEDDSSEEAETEAEDFEEAEIEDGDLEEETDGEAEEPYVCGEPVSVPVDFTQINGFTGAEDFAFDRDGNLVSNDNGNLVKQTKDGDKKLIVSNISAGTSGIAFLPGGDIVMCDSENGSLVRVFANGSYDTVLSGINYPNGIEVDQEGFVYVSEHSSGRIRRINPDTGDFEIIADDLYNPNGMAFNTDYTTLYVNSFGGGTVHAISRNGKGDWERKFFGSVPGVSNPVEICEGKVEGDACQSNVGVGSGVCKMEAGQLECVIGNPCDGKEVGDECIIWDQVGECRETIPGIIECVMPQPCDGKEEGDECDNWGTPGICTDNGNGLECVVPGPCDGKEEGDECDSWGMPGICTVSEWGLDCVTVGPCDGKEEGDECDNWGTPGICTENGYGLECITPGPCDGKEEGDDCDAWGTPGICTVTEWGLDCIAPLPCEGKVEGDECQVSGQTGVCQISEWQSLECVLPPPCEGKIVGDTCVSNGSDGVCADYNGYIYCEPNSACDGQYEGAYCYLAEAEGFCTFMVDKLHCVPNLPCQGKEVGDSCFSYGQTGYCRMDGEGQLYCYFSGMGSDGGLDGLTVDYCGYVYVTEYTTGQVFRFSSSGSEPELLFETGKSWIPNLHFGSSAGGWDAQSVYIMVRDDMSVLEVPLNVPGVPDPYINMESR